MVLVDKSEAIRFITDCMSSVGCDKEVGEQVGELLTTADAKGHGSHGINRVSRYIAEVNSGFCSSKASPKILKETGSTAWVDGESALGVVVGTYCMNLAMSKARGSGIGFVSAKRSNHFGIAGYYSEMAMREGMVGMAFCNSPPLMVPTRAKQAALGSNPIACAAPGSGSDSFSLDMATTCKAAGKIELYRTKGDKLPEGWAVDLDGNTTTDPEEAMKGQPKLMPLGGLEDNSGYKGFGLGYMVEIFSSVLSDANFGGRLRTWTPASNMDFVGENNFGQCFIAIDPGCFAPGFPDRNQELMDHIRGLETADPERPIKIPGDMERESIAKCVDRGQPKQEEEQQPRESQNREPKIILDYHEKLISKMEELAKTRNVRPMEAFSRIM